VESCSGTKCKLLPVWFVCDGVVHICMRIFVVKIHFLCFHHSGERYQTW
jgi:hypothetical protein